MKNNMKIAVCFLGYLKTDEKYAQRLKENYDN